MVDKQKRDKTIDVLRGLAIILVVVGHAIQSSYTDFDSNLVFRYIYASHMPLFMFVSGYAAGFSGGGEKRISLYKKFLALIIPFISWYTVAYFINQSWRTIELKTYVSRVIASPDWGLWFLPVLFLCYLLLALGKKFEARLGIAAYFIIWFSLQFVPVAGFGLDLLKWHFAFFIVGYLANYKYRLDSLRAPAWLVWSLGAVYVGTVLLWHRTMSSIDLHALPFLPIPGHDLTHPVLVLTFKYCTALLGIAFWWAVVATFKNVNLKNRLSYLGLFTLDIYVCHLYLFRFSLGGGFFRIVSNIGLGLALPLALSYLLLRRFSLLNRLFLGNRPLSDF